MARPAPRADTAASASYAELKLNVDGLDKI
jgi:hypothetical protein